MTAITWDQLDQRRFEAGVSRGVFYPATGPGVVWNGLKSVEEDSVGGETTEHNLDGVNYLNFVTGSNFQAKITALSAPEGFGKYVGAIPHVPGMIVTKQPKMRFNLAYTTQVSDTLGYKLHLIYNILASPSKRGFETINDSPKPSEFEWKLDATPVLSPGIRPTAYFVVDSTKTAPLTLQALENLLFGTVSTDPAFPSVTTLRAMFA